MSQDGHHQRQDVGIGNVLEVDERRIAQHATIGPECAESYHGDEHIYKYGVDNAPEVCNVVEGLMVSPEDYQACQEGGCTVEDEHTPIRECLTLEIPVGKFL